MMPFDLTKSTSVHVLPVTGAYPEPDLRQLEELIESSSQLLPAYGPIGGFAFQNPLHALEYLPFDQAVQAGGRLFGCQPYLSEDQYRQAMVAGRIQAIDLRAILEEEEQAWGLVNRLSSRLHLRMTMLMVPICVATAPEIEWLLAEKEILSRFPEVTANSTRLELVADVKRWVIRDLVNSGSADGAYNAPQAGDPRARHLLFPLFQKLAPLLQKEDRGADDRTDEVWEEFTLRALWQVCLDGIRRTPQATASEAIPGERLRDLLFRVTGADTDQKVHELLIRFSAAFTDQGISHWHLPGKSLGYYRCFLELYGQGGSPPDAWLRALVPELTRLRTARMGPLDSIRESLELLGIDQAEWAAFLPATLAALRGWASVIRQMEVRSDRVQHPVPRGTLIEFLAVRLILERLALAHLAREQIGYRGELSKLRETLLRTGVKKPQRIEERAFTVFQLALRAGWKASVLHELSGADWAALQTEIDSFGDLERRRVFHSAFERRTRTLALEAIAARVKKPPRKPARSRFQVVCCIDAREESFRRHLEELCPDTETFGMAGFFGVPIYYRGLGEAFPSAQCPIVMRPQHWVVEEPIFQLAEVAQARARTRHLLGTISHRLRMASRGSFVGAIVSSLLGNLALIPLVAQVLLPRWASWFARLGGADRGPAGDAPGPRTHDSRSRTRGWRGGL